MMIYLVEVSIKALLEYHGKYPNERPNVLFSFARTSRDLANAIFRHTDLIGSVILDSGTFSLHQNPRKFAKKVTFQGYKAFLQQLADNFDFVFNFDKDYSKKGFDCNLAYQLDLEEAGLHPVPVVHDSFGPEIPYYIANRHKYPIVAIGSGELERASVSKLYRIVEPLYSKGIKVHFLGCTRYEKLAKIPVFSADSSTWKHSGSGGPLLYWNRHKRGFNKGEEIMIDDLSHHPQRLEIEEYLESELSYTVADFKKKGGHTKMLVANMHYFIEMEKRVAEEHRKRGFKFWV